MLILSTSVMTCGPTPMMKGVAQWLKTSMYHAKFLEERMGCGTGGCLGCGCDGAEGKRYKVCKDGPVFPAEGGVLLMSERGFK